MAVKFPMTASAEAGMVMFSQVKRAGTGIDVPPRAEYDPTAEIVAQTRERYGSIPTTVPPSDEAPAAQLVAPKPPVTPPAAPRPDKQPIPAQPPAGTIKEKILHYVGQAEYLSPAQIIELCFAH